MCVVQCKVSERHLHPKVQSKTKQQTRNRCHTQVSAMCLLLKYKEHFAAKCRLLASLVCLTRSPRRQAVSRCAPERGHDAATPGPCGPQNPCRWRFGDPTPTWLDGGSGSCEWRWLSWGGNSEKTFALRAVHTEDTKDCGGAHRCVTLHKKRGHCFLSLLKDYFQQMPLNFTRHYLNCGTI